MGSVVEIIKDMTMVVTSMDIMRTININTTTSMVVDFNIRTHLSNLIISSNTTISSRMHLKGWKMYLNICSGTPRGIDKETIDNSTEMIVLFKVKIKVVGSSVELVTF